MKITSKECDAIIAIFSILTLLMWAGCLICFFLMRCTQIDIMKLAMLSVGFVESAAIGMIITLFLLFFLEPTN